VGEFNSSDGPTESLASAAIAAISTSAEDAAGSKRGISEPFGYITNRSVDFYSRRCRSLAFEPEAWYMRPVIATRVGRGGYGYLS
jgi:hypothetical protein